MSDAVVFVAAGVVMGVTGSALMDAWSFVLRRRFHVPTLDYALLGTSRDIRPPCPELRRLRARQRNPFGRR